MQRKCLYFNIFNGFLGDNPKPTLTIELNYSEVFVVIFLFLLGILAILGIGWWIRHYGTKEKNKEIQSVIWDADTNCEME